MDTDSSTESEESYSEEEDAEKEEEQSLLVLDDDQGEKVDIILEKETYHIKASSTGLTIHANTSKTITIDKPMEERNNHVYLFDVTHPTLLPAQGYFDPCTSLVSNKRNLEIHIFNRTGKDIQIEPEEELGILEKFNLQKDTIVNAYNLSDNPELCALERRHISEVEEDEKTLDSDLLDKFETQDLSDDIKLELKSS
ncbi:hypothetical protein G6F20_013514 [Rhizopus arrhizus]|nr:hypothetical protein G6F20_013514 [Rhizopus arrhizus]